MSLHRLENPTLQKPKLRLLIEMDLAPGTLKATSEDLYVDGATLDGLYEKLLADKPQLSEVDSDLDPFGGTTTLSFTLPNARTAEYPNGRFSPWFAVDPRGCLVRAHVYDVTTAEEVLGEFNGKITRFSQQGLDRIRVECATFVQKKLNLPAMSRLVEQAQWPAAPANPLGLGARFSRGYGVGLRVPLCWVRAPTDEDPTPFFDYAVEGTCAVQDVRAGDSGQFTAAGIEGEDFTVLDVLVGGVPYTLLRFTLQPLGTITANVQRLGFDHSADALARFPWTSFRDAVAGLRLVPGTHAELGTSDLTTGQLVAGPTGVGLGGLLLSGALSRPYAQVENAEALATQTFTWQFPLYVERGGGPLIVSPLATTDSGSATRHGWALEVSFFQELKLHSHFTGDSAYTLVGTTAALAPATWSLVTVVRDETAGEWRVYIDRTEALHVTDSGGPGTLDYGGTDPLMVGAWKSGGTALYASDLRLGEVRIWSTAFTAAQVAESVDRLRRNPIPWMQETFARADDTLDPTTRAASITTLDTTPGGPLHCDHWITDPAVSHRDVLFAVAQMRSMRFGRTTAGAVTIVVPIEAPNAVASFGMGKGTAGNATFISREVGELGAAVKTLPVVYRPLRDAAGTPVGFLGPIRRQVLVLPGDDGEAEGQPLVLPCVYDHRTADQCLDWLAKFRRRQDEALIFEAATESRRITRGDVVHLDFPGVTVLGDYSAADYDPEGYVTTTTLLADYEVRARNLSGPARRRFLCMPYLEEQFQYDAGPLLVDPVVDHSAELQLGNATAIEQTSFQAHNGDFPRSMGVRLLLLHHEELLPTASDPATVSGITINQGTVTGAATHLEALRDADDASYIAVAGATTGPPTVSGSLQSVTFAASARARGRVTRLAFVARAKLASGGASSIHPGFLWGFRAVGTGDWAFGPGTLGAQALTGAFADYLAEAGGSTSPFTGGPWMAGDLRSTPGVVGTGELRCAAGVTAPSGATVHIARMAVLITAEQDPPLDFGGVKWFAKLSSGTVPPDPIEGVDPGSTLQPGLDYTFPEATLTEPGIWYVWAMVFDALGRRAALVGPQMMLVPG